MRASNSSANSILKQLKQAILDHEKNLIQALHADLNKPEQEAYSLEIHFKKEIDYTLKNLNNWVKPQTAAIPFYLLPGTAQTYPEPLGIILMISPWNYPFQLTITPLIGAIAAGNCAIIKPSEHSPHTSDAIATLIAETFPANFISVIQGDIEISQALLAQKFDHIFFTGSSKVGKIVMESAAKTLTPVTLELGGKSPCIVESEIDLDCTARRIIWGKFINTGQSCIAPDYLLVNRSIKSALIAKLQETIQTFFGQDPAQSPDYGRIINQTQFERLSALLQQGEIICGGKTNASDRYIAPTMIDNPPLDSDLMETEIFGPILPILEYNDFKDAIAFINARPKPLAIYFFSNNKTQQNLIIQSTSSGSLCINDTMVQAGISELPFGGVGNSGMGRYHGKASFDTFSHLKSICKRSFLFDLNLRYPPYAGKLNLLKRLLG